MPGSCGSVSFMQSASWRIPRSLWSKSLSSVASRTKRILPGHSRRSQGSRLQNGAVSSVPADVRACPQPSSSPFALARLEPMLWIPSSVALYDAGQHRAVCTNEEVMADACMLAIDIDERSFQACKTEVTDRAGHVLSNSGLFEPDVGLVRRETQSIHNSRSGSAFALATWKAGRSVTRFRYARR